MAISPSEVSLSSDEEESLAFLERLIDRILLERENYRSKSRCSSECILVEGLPELQQTSRRFQNELKRRYEAAGWGEVRISESADRWYFYYTTF